MKRFPRRLNNGLRNQDPLQAKASEGDRVICNLAFNSCNNLFFIEFQIFILVASFAFNFMVNLHIQTSTKIPEVR